MKTTTRSLFLAAGCVMAGSAFAEPAVQVRTEGLPTHMKQQVQAAAQQGPTALRQYLQRTRMVGYNLRMEEVVTNADLVGVQSKSPEAVVVISKTAKVAAR